MEQQSYWYTQNQKPHKLQEWNTQLCLSSKLPYDRVNRKVAAVVLLKLSRTCNKEVVISPLAVRNGVSSPIGHFYQANPTRILADRGK